ncbi:MAG: hypothetical protein GXO28_02025 [Methanopyri archaeon]|nr:hypothetical protein [Methanopyri archaeon]
MELGDVTDRGRSVARRSLRVLSEMLGEPEGLEDVLALRVTHATWDPFFQETLRVVPDGDSVLEGVRGVETVVVDVGMVAEGVRRSVEALGASLRVASREGERVEGDTVTGSGMRRILEEESRVAVVVGNAPTAAEKLLERPGPVEVAVVLPVGVGALEVKRRLLEDPPFPVVTNVSYRGGTPAAVAVFNAVVSEALGGRG